MMNRFIPSASLLAALLSLPAAAIAQSNTCTPSYPGPAAPVPKRQGVKTEPAPELSFAVIDLGASGSPIKLTNSGFVLITDGEGGFRWKDGVLQRLSYTGSLNGGGGNPRPRPVVQDINEAGTVVGSIIGPASSFVPPEQPSPGFTFSNGDSDCPPPWNDPEWYGPAPMYLSWETVMPDPAPYYGFGTKGGLIWTAASSNCSQAVLTSRFEQLLEPSAFYLIKSQWPDGEWWCDWSVPAYAGFRIHEYTDSQEFRCVSANTIFGTAMKPYQDLNGFEYVGQVGQTWNILGPHGASDGSSDIVKVNENGYTIGNRSVNGSTVTFYPDDISQNGTVIGHEENHIVLYPLSGFGTQDLGVGLPLALNDVVTYAADGSISGIAHQILGSRPLTSITPSQPVLGVPCVEDSTKYYWHNLQEAVNKTGEWQLAGVTDMNDSGLILATARRSDGDGEPRPVLLLPVEVKDIKDHVNTGDDVVILNWATGQEIADANVAWIEAHKSATDDTPRMPQLVFNILGFPQGVTLEAKLLVEYERPYAGKQADDTVRIPTNGSFKSVTNGRWEIWNEYTDIPFFGGDATLTYKINGGVEQTVKFAIGGRNPEDPRCKAYTQGRPNAPWYAYAIEKHESQAYNPGFYNQFWERSGNSSPINNGVNYTFTKGDPLVVRSPGETGVGGAGLAQVTGANGVKTVPAPREIFWNWQKNVDSFLNIMAGKIQIAETFMNDPTPRSGPGSMPNGQRPQTTFHTGHNVPVPSRVQGLVTFGDSQEQKRPEDAVAIKAYNGAAAHWCSWGGPSVYEWQFNYGQNNYVEEVCNQVEEAQP